MRGDRSRTLENVVLDDSGHGDGPVNDDESAAAEIVHHSVADNEKFVARIAGVGPFFLITYESAVLRQRALLNKISDDE